MNKYFSYQNIIDKLFRSNKEDNNDFDECSKLLISNEEIQLLFNNSFLEKLNSSSCLNCQNNQLQKQLSFYTPLSQNESEDKNMVEFFTNNDQNQISKYITFLFLNNSISDNKVIFNRNTIIKHFLSLNNNNQYKELFSKLKNIEDDVLWILKKGTLLSNDNSSSKEKENDIIQSTLFYNSPFLQILNKNYYFQTAYYFYNLYIYPVYQLIQPFVVFIIAYFVMNQLGKRLGIKLPFSFFMNLAKNQILNFFNFKSSNPTWYGKTIHVFSKLFYMLLTVYSVVQMIFNKIFINRVTNFIHLKLRVINELTDMMNIINNDLILSKSNFIDSSELKCSLFKECYFKKPISYFYNKGYITSEYYQILTDDDINMTIRNIWLHLSYLNSLFCVSQSLNKCSLIGLNCTFLEEENFGKNIKNMNIKNGYHPLLLETFSDEESNNIVKNNYDSKKNMLIITGPNASGKSVYLKMIATNCLLAHSLGFVFADDVKMPIFNRLMIHMGNRDVVGQKSLFEAEVINANEILSGINDDDNGFYIFDELFSSTNSKEGQKTTENYVSKLIECKNQICILSTHYSVGGMSKNKQITNSCDFRKLGKKYKVLKGINKVKGGMHIYKKILQHNKSKEIIKEENI